jgi:hypothetical protein
MHGSISTDGGSNPHPAHASDEGRARWCISKKIKKSWGWMALPTNDIKCSSPAPLYGHTWCQSKCRAQASVSHQERGAVW